MPGSALPFNAARAAAFNPLSAWPVAAQWHPTRNGNRTPDDVSAQSGVKYWWVGECGHEWPATPANRTRQGSGCPWCSKRGKKHRPSSGQFVLDPASLTAGFSIERTFWTTPGGPEGAEFPTARDALTAAVAHERENVRLRDTHDPDAPPLRSLISMDMNWLVIDPAFGNVFVRVHRVSYRDLAAAEEDLATSG